MKELSTVNKAMSSLDLVILINEFRGKDGKVELFHSDFLKKVKKVLGKDEFYQWMREQGILFVYNCLRQSMVSC